ncbi:MAG: hypothetical protein WDO56_25845 [Gammaproteobacteria bacterium]
MKGTVPRPYWPAPAGKTATHTQRSNDQTNEREPPIDESNRITLAVLEEFSAAKARGYDPYNASAARHRPVDVWKRKPKRD